MVCAGERPPRNSSLTRRFTVSGSVGAKRCFRPDIGRPVCLARRNEDRLNRRNLSQGTPDRDQYGLKKGGADV